MADSPDMARIRQDSAGSVPGPPLAALIPAAGLSSRMRGYKPLLPLGKTTLIETVIALFQGVGIRDILVVTGHNHDRLAPVVENSGARVVYNPAYETGMFSSIRAGVAALSTEIQGFFLLPADIPAVRPATLIRLMATFENQPDRVAVPVFSGEPGHPPLITASLIPVIIGAGPDANLRKILFSDLEKVQQVWVPDQGILLDADTPEAYEMIKTKFRTLDIPNGAECMEILNQALGAFPDIRDHSVRVAAVAGRLWQALACPDLNPELIRAGALLHDIRRRESDHALAARDFLSAWGFPKVGEIVAVHTDHPVLDGPLEESEIVFLADKLCCGSRLEPDVEQRFNQKMKEFPHAQKEIRQRLDTVRHIQARIEALAGRSVRDILG